MDGYCEREDIACIIEAALATYDYSTDDRMRDDDAIRIMEMLFDTYHFGEVHISDSNKLLENGYKYVVDYIQQDLPSVNIDELIKIIGAIYFVARRRNVGRRNYLAVIRQYVGVNIKGMGRIKMIDNGS